MPPDPPSSSRLRRSWCPPPINLTLLRHCTPFLHQCSAFRCTGIRDFKIPDSDDNENGKKKGIGWIGKTNCARASRFFCTFLFRHWTTTTGKCLISHFMEDVNKPRPNFLSHSELNIVLRNSAQKEFPYIWQSKWVGIIIIEIERTQIHFLSDFFVAVAVVVS